MTKLIRAGLNRLKKSSLFWGIFLFTLFVSCFLLYTNYTDKVNYNYVIDLYQLYLNGTNVSGLVMAVFTSLFIGREYSDGTLRNKIILHISRTKIYLSNLVLVYGVSMLMAILHLAVISLIGIPLFGPLQMACSDILFILVCLGAILLAYSAIFTFIAMILSNKTVSAIASMLLVFGMMTASAIMINRLYEPEYSTIAQVIDGKYDTVQIKNPKYLNENQKKICLQLIQSLPEGQRLLISGSLITDFHTFPFYSLGSAILFTGSGLLLFRRKELK